MRLLSARAGRGRAARPSPSPPAASRSRSRPRSSASRPTGAAPSRRRPPRAAASGRCAASGASGRGSSGSTSSPPVKAYDAAVRYKLAQIAGRVDRSGRRREARAPGPRRPRRRGHDRAGKLDRTAAAATVVAALSALRARHARSRCRSTTTEPRVQSDDLADAATQARTALSAPIRLAYGETRWRVPRWRIAPLLALPAGGQHDRRDLRAAAPRSTWSGSRRPSPASRRTRASRSRPPGKIVIRPSAPGLQLDIPATAKAIAAAAFSADQRTATLVVQVAEPAADDGGREDDGDHGRRLVVHDDLRRHAGAPQQRAARRAS